MTSTMQFLKKRVAIVIVIVILLTAGGWFFFVRDSEPPRELIKVTRGGLTQEVTVTGSTKPANDVDLAFQTSGRINRVYVEVGDTVAAGQVLATLDDREIGSSLREAQANVEVQAAKLAALARGTRPEDLRIKETDLKKSAQDLANQYGTVPNTLADAYAKAEDAVRKQTDQLFLNDEDATPQLTFATKDSQLATDVQNQRFQSGRLLDVWKRELAPLTSASPKAALDTALSNAFQYLTSVRAFLNRTTEILTGTIGLPQATVDTYRANLSTAINEVNTALTNVVSGQQSIAAQSIVVERTANELALAQAGSTPEDIAAQEAAVKQAEAKVEIIKAQLDEMVLRSPIGGVVTRADAKAGQTVAANQTLISVISKSRLEIEANVPEVDIGKVAVGNSAAITLDAYGNDVSFDAKVVSIDPAETVIEGVATYRTKLNFGREDSRIKPGMTANITIATAKRENILIIPQRVINSKNGQTFVLVDNGEPTPEKRIVKTGIKGSNGNMEVIEGVREGDTIVIVPEEK